MVKTLDLGLFPEVIQGIVTVFGGQCLDTNPILSHNLHIQKMYTHHDVAVSFTM